MTRRAAVLAIALGVAPASASGQSSFSVRDVLSYSFASGLVASPAGDRIAWIENAEGVRNIWVAQGPEWSGRALTDYDVDDGQEVAALSFTPNGSRILYVRGGAPNRQGEVPDPLYTPDEEGRAVWVVAVSGGAPTKVADTGGFAISPDGERIAFARGGEVFTVGVTDEEEPAQIAKIRGSVGSLTWAPDGERLAFRSGRGDHAFIGVLDLEASRVTYLDPSVANDGSPAWSTGSCCTSSGWPRSRPPRASSTES